MLNRLIRFSLAQRGLVLVVALVLLVFGIKKAVEMPVDVLPDLTKPTVTLLTEAPGYAPKTYPLVAAHEVAKKGVFGRAGDALIHMIRSSGDSDAAGGEAADSADG